MLPGVGLPCLWGKVEPSGSFGVKIFRGYGRSVVRCILGFFGGLGASSFLR